MAKEVYIKLYYQIEDEELARLPSWDDADWGSVIQKAVDQQLNPLMEAVGFTPTKSPKLYVADELPF